MSLDNEKTTCKLLGLELARHSYPQVMQTLEAAIETGQKWLCATPNLDIMRLAYKNADFYKVLSHCDYLFADGMPLIWASKLTKTPLPERVAGCDVMQDLLKLSADKGYRVVLFGAGPGVAEQAAEIACQRWPGVNIVGAFCPSKEDLASSEGSKAWVEKINALDCQILLVGLGAPKQELWLSHYYEALNPMVMLPCGGSIDFVAGTQPKAPGWIGKIGFEWLYRLLGNPQKFYQRYLVDDLPFLFTLLYKTWQEPAFCPHPIQTTTQSTKSA